MQANTKLSTECKRDRKEMLSHLKDNGCDYSFGYNNPITVLRYLPFPGARMARYYVAICSPNETKYRKKVGEYQALVKFGEGLWINYPAEMSAQDFAYMLGDNTGYEV